MKVGNLVKSYGYCGIVFEELVLGGEKWWKIYWFDGCSTQEQGENVEVIHESGRPCKMGPSR